MEIACKKLKYGRVDFVLTKTWNIILLTDFVHKLFPAIGKSTNVIAS